MHDLYILYHVSDRVIASQRQRHVGLLICTCVLHTSCNMMSHFLNLYLLRAITGRSVADSPVYRTFVAISNILVTLGYTADFILFYIFNKQFRDVTKRTIPCYWRRNFVKVSNASSSTPQSDVEVHRNTGE